jgi:hypothetical protein
MLTTVTRLVRISLQDLKQFPVFMNITRLEVDNIHSERLKFCSDLTSRPLHSKNSQENGPIRHVETCPDFFSLQEYTQQNTLSKF